MNDSNQSIDARLAALLADRGPPRQDERFINCVLALASFDLRQRRARRRALARIGREALALVAVLASFATLSRLSPQAAVGLGDSISLSSPAMLGLAMLLGWGVVAARETGSAR